MNDFYQSPFAPPTNYQQPTYYQAPQEQPQQVTLGPYNAEQAPSIECESCGQPITVGQELVEIRRWRLALQYPPVQLCFWPAEEAKMASQYEQQSIYVHSDCSAEYAHDHITKEPCGEEADAERFCAGCGAKLDGDGDE